MSDGADLAILRLGFCFGVAPRKPSNLGKVQVNPEAGFLDLPLGIV